MYYSQYGQDKWLNQNVFHDKKGGIFLDVGAHDGVTINNTYYFEKKLKWTGLCVEPIPSVYKKLKENRNCETLKACVWTDNSKKEFNVIEGYSEMLSGLSDQYTPEHKQRVENEVASMGQKMKKITVECHDINDILSKLLGTTGERTLDLLSIDTEGSEEEIIRHIDLKRYKISVIVMENNYNHEPIRTYMSKKGYRLVAKCEIDDIFQKVEGLQKIKHLAKRLVG